DALLEALRRSPAESEPIGIALSPTAWPAGLAPLEALSTDASGAPASRAAGPRERAAMKAAEVMKELQKRGTAQTRKTWIRHGCPEPLFGVKIADMKVL